MLLDLNMPGIDGEQLLELLRDSDSCTVPVIFHSADQLWRLQQKARQCKVLGAVAKTEDDSAFIAQFMRLFLRASASHSASSPD